MADNENRYDLPTVAKKLQDIRFAMFGTHQGARMRARPMTTLQVTDDGLLWFFGVRDSELANEVAAEPRVGLTYADNSNGTYAFVSGKGYLREDRAKVDELWNPLIKAWFDGPDDPDLQLIEVQLETAEYWDSPDSGVFRLVGMVRAAVTGDEHEVGTHGEVSSAGSRT